MKRYFLVVPHLLISLLVLMLLSACGQSAATVTGAIPTAATGTDTAKAGIALDKIDITKPALKLSYYVGDSLSIDGLEVTGTYADGTKKVLALSDANISGFDSTVPAKGQTLTVSIEGKTAAYQVNVIPRPDKSSFQGYSPFDIAITKDGQYAYICFDLTEAILKIRLSDLSIVTSADLSAYFPIECEGIALDGSEKKLFLYSSSQKKLLVLNTDTMKIIHTIDNYSLGGMVRSKFHSQLITWDGGPTVQIINMDTYTITKKQIANRFVRGISESPDDPTKWYVVAQEQPGGQGPLTVGVISNSTMKWINKVNVPLPAQGAGIFDFCVLPGGQKAYIATLDGWYPDYHAFGSLCAVDFTTKKSKTVAIDGGASCLALNSTGTQLFVGTGWPSPNTNNLVVVDTASDSIAQWISLDKSEYGWAFTQMNRLKMDPDYRFLYATSTDGNAFLKFDADKHTLAGVRILNTEAFRPNYFVRSQSQPLGYLLIGKSARSFELNTDTAEIQSVVQFPEIRKDVNSFDIGVLKTGRLLIAQGEQFLEVDSQNMQLIEKHPISSGAPSIWKFILSEDKTKVYSVTNSPDGTNNMFVVMNTSGYTVDKQFALPGGVFEARPFELPGGSKIYALGGLQNGHIMIHVINAADYSIQKTITFDQPDCNGISAGPYCPYAYNPASHTLYVGATNVVLAIDTIKDEVQKVIYLKDVASVLGLQPQQLTFCNAIGLVFNPKENYLYIAHLDRSFISIYDLTKGKFLTRVIPLKGLFPNMLFANDDVTKIFSINIRSDSVSVIDTATKKVEKVLNLHSYLSKP